MLPLVAVVALVVGLTSWWDGGPAEADDPLGMPLVPAAAGAEALSSTWFCAAGSAGTPRPPRRPEHGCGSWRVHSDRVH
jgi:hypothetical protein